ATQEDVLQSVGHGSAVPLQRTDLSADLATLGVDQQGGGETFNPENGWRSAGRIEIDPQRMHSEIAIEGPHDRDALPINRDREHLKPRATELRLQAIERWHLLATRR